MKINLIKKFLTIGIVLLLILTGVSAVGNKIDEDNTKLYESIMKGELNNELQQEIIKELNNNNTSRYLIISGGMRASSFFVKFPRIFSQRGFIFAGQIWYRSSFAVTLVFEKNNSRYKLKDFERGIHRVAFIGFGHSSFTRPHLFSNGRIIVLTKTKPIVF